MCSFSVKPLFFQAKAKISTAKNKCIRVNPFFKPKMYFLEQRINFQDKPLFQAGTKLQKQRIDFQSQHLLQTNKQNVPFFILYSCSIITSLKMGFCVVWLKWAFCFSYFVHFDLVLECWQLTLLQIFFFQSVYADYFELWLAWVCTSC